MSRATTRAERDNHGRAVLDAIDGAAGANVVAALEDIAPELGHQVVPDQAQTYLLAAAVTCGTTDGMPHRWAGEHPEQAVALDRRGKVDFGLTTPIAGPVVTVRCALHRPAPDAVFTVRTYGDTRSPYGPQSARLAGMSWAESYHGKLRALAGDEEVLIMIGARCLLRDDQGRILLIKRSDNGLWAVPAGGIELGETIRQCAIREVYEETGLTPTKLAPIAILSGADSIETNQWGHTYQFHMTVFLATAWTGDLVTQTDESTDAGWFHPDQIPTPHTAIVETSTQLLTQYDRTGEFLAP